MNSTQHEPRATNEQLQKRLNQLKKQTASMRKKEIKIQQQIDAVHKQIKKNWKMHPEYVKEKSDKLQKLDDMMEQTYGNRRQTEYFMEDMEKELQEENSTEGILSNGILHMNIRYNAYAHPDYERKYFEEANPQNGKKASDKQKTWEQQIDEALEQYEYEIWEQYESGYDMSEDWEHEK